MVRCSSRCGTLQSSPKARIEMGAVQWPNGADLAPDAMYDAIRQSGVWTLE